MSEQTIYREFDAAAIVAAYRQTEIMPVRSTWELYWTKVDPATGKSRPVPCGCALVALVRADGIDPAMPREQGIPPEEGYAQALDCDPEHAKGIVLGWDSFRRTPHAIITQRLSPRSRGYMAAWEAAKEVLG